MGFFSSLNPFRPINNILHGREAFGIGSDAAGDVVDPGGFLHETVAQRTAREREMDKILKAQRDAIRYAADRSLEGTKAAINAQKEFYQQARQDTAPWRTGGAMAVNRLAEIIQRGPGDYTQSPGYQFRLSEGQKAIERSAAARGRALDPATMKALTRYGQDYATADYDNYLRRYYQSLTPYQSLAGVGMTGTGMVTTSGTNAANQISGAQMANAANLGNLSLMSGNAQANTLAAKLNANLMAQQEQRSNAMGVIGGIISAIF